eukprot:CAMPEP_0119039278 /NCGR_PEP_ID=MMETSP1177-20130426/8675_1 /TAXON_ID=2985 /ORGANISM="Ochromonas sp, Strain CCMP1899" /LENGTH=221 /DNA_ID=CAMNT_0007002949 /DNA_START=116 /DNA_END=781 /DNA_ORIENTATION=-
MESNRGPLKNMIDLRGLCVAMTAGCPFNGVCNKSEATDGFLFTFTMPLSFIRLLSFNSLFSLFASTGSPPPTIYPPETLCRGEIHLSLVHICIKSPAFTIKGNDGDDGDDDDDDSGDDGGNDGDGDIGNDASVCDCDCGGGGGGVVDVGVDDGGTSNDNDGSDDDDNDGDGSDDDNDDDGSDDDDNNNDSCDDKPSKAGNLIGIQCSSPSILILTSNPPVV